MRKRRFLEKNEKKSPYSVFCGNTGDFQFRKAKGLFDKTFTNAFIFGIGIQSFLYGFGFLLNNPAGFAGGGLSLLNRGVKLPVKLFLIILIIYRSCGDKCRDQKKEYQKTDKSAFCRTALFRNNSGRSFSGGGTFGITALRTIIPAVCRNGNAVSANGFAAGGAAGHSFSISVIKTNRHNKLHV